MSGQNRKVVLLFVDGLGIGSNDSKKNPCTAPVLKIFNNFLEEDYPKKILFGGYALPLDALLGIPGIPQSATGQTTLLTGKNAAALLGYHLPAFPNEALRRLIYQESILKKVTDHGKTAAFINAYSPIYFQRGPEQLKSWLSVTSHATLASGFNFFNFEDLKNERAIYQEFTNQVLIQKGYDLPEFSPEKAGNILAHASANFDFSLYEYFQTDHAGHSQNFLKATAELIKLERFLFSFLTVIALERTVVIFTSDHGNLEDLSIGTHTKNPAMTCIWGPGIEEMAYRLHSIQDIAAEISQILNL